MIRFLVGLIVIIILGLAAAGWWTVRGLGGFEQVSVSFAGDCIRIEGLTGAEDLEIDHATGTVFISSHDRRAPETRGSIFRVNADQTSYPDEFVDLTRGVPAAFAPHGLSVLRLDDETLYVLVINHAGPTGDDGHPTSVVEVYRQDEEGFLQHDVTLSHPLIRNPNDLAAIGTRAFFVTNDLGAPKHDERAQQIELLTKQAGGSVVFYDSGEAIIAYPDVKFANGIVVAPNETDVFVSEMLERRVLMLQRQTIQGQLGGGRALITPGVFPDNLDLDEDGRLWVGGHPNLLQFASHASDPEALSPGVIQYRADDGVMTQRFATSGELISGLSVAARHADHLFIGSVFEPHILKCRMAQR